MLHTTRATVGKWMLRFLEDCEGLLDEPRPDAPRTLSDDDMERVVVRTLETLPRGATQSNCKSMARAYGLSAWTVGRVSRAFGLKPNGSETFKLSKDPIVRGESTGYRGPVLGSARTSGRLVRGREVADVVDPWTAMQTWRERRA